MSSPTIGSVSVFYTSNGLGISQPNPIQPMLTPQLGWFLLPTQVMGWEFPNPISSGWIERPPHL